MNLFILTLNYGVVIIGMLLKLWSSLSIQKKFIPLNLFDYSSFLSKIYYPVLSVVLIFKIIFKIMTLKNTHPQKKKFSSGFINYVKKFKFVTTKHTPPSKNILIKLNKYPSISNHLPLNHLPLNPLPLNPLPLIQPPISHPSNTLFSVLSYLISLSITYLSSLSPHMSSSPHSSVHYLFCLFS